MAIVWMSHYPVAINLLNRHNSLLSCTIDTQPISIVKNCLDSYILIKLRSPCRAGNGWWWVPVVAPLLGGVMGAGLYKVLIELHHPAIVCDQNGNQEQEEMDPLEKHNHADVCV